MRGLDLPCNANHPCISASIVAGARAATEVAPNKVDIGIGGGDGAIAGAGVVDDVGVVADAVIGV